MKKFILLLTISVLLQAQSLSKEQLQKLNLPVVTDKNNSYVIEEYNKVTFTKPVLFGGSNTAEIIIKTHATMKKNIIHKEQFIAISSTVSDQMMQSVIFLPEYFEYIKTNELLTIKPIGKSNLNIDIHVVKDGIKIKLYSKNQNVEKFVPYSEMFLSKIR